MKQAVHKVDEPCNISLNDFDYSKNNSAIVKIIVMHVFLGSHDTLRSTHGTFLT